MLYHLSLMMLAFGIYSFAGWCTEVVITAISKRCFINRGMMSGPVQPIYGVMALMASVLFEPDENGLLTMLVFSTVLCIVVELLVGTVLSHVFHMCWWDYSGEKYNIMGLVGLKSSLIKGTLVALCAKFLHPLLIGLLQLLPKLATEITALVVIVLFVMDGLFTLFSLGLMRHSWKSCGRIAAALQDTADNIGGSIAQRTLAASRRHQQRHIAKAFPNLACLVKSGAEPAEKPAAFAAGMGFYKLFWLFLIGAFVGDVVETIFVFLSSGVLMSRSSFLYGPFSMVWGLGCMLMSLVLQAFVNKNDRYVFVGGALLGGVYEYVCSVVTEICFGKVFWDYSKIPFNINGRVNLLYCLFWGVAAVIWVKELYPRLSGLIEKLPARIGKTLTWILLVLLMADTLITCAAMGRLQARENGVQPQNAVETFLDEQYPDEYMYHRYQNMFKTEE